jgi:hypothetical protein
MRIGIGIVLLMVIATGEAWAGNVDWNVNVNLGSGRTAPAPAPYPWERPPVVVSGPPIGAVIVSTPPLFLAPPQLGFWVAVNVPYDMVFIDGYYFLNHGNYWHVSPSYHGPWQVIVHEHLPPGLRKHKHSKIRDHRDKEYQRYAQEGPTYRGQHYRPENRKGQGNSGKGKGENGKGKGHR